MLVVVLAGAAADVGARELAETELTSRVRERVPSASAITAEIDSLPFLGRLAASGEIRTASVHLEDVTASSLEFASITVDLDGVVLDRGRLLRQRDVVVEGIGRGRVTAVLGMSQVLRLAGAALAGDLRLEDGVLVIGDVRIDLGGVPLMPCASDLRFVGATIVLTCSFDDVPDELVDEANAAA